MRTEAADLDIRYFDEVITLEGAERVVLRVPEGSIKVSASPDGQIHVDSELHGNVAGLDAWPISVRRHDSILILATDTPQDVYPIAVSFQIPEHVKDLEVHSLGGEIDLRDCKTNVLVSSELGNVHIYGVQGAEVSSVKGTVTVSNSGSTTVNTLEGNVHCSKISGSLYIETQDGDVQASQVKGNVIVLSKNGDVSVIRPEGRIRLVSRAGDIELEVFEVFGGGEVSTYSGDVNIMLEDANVEFRAETLSGQINSPGTTVANGVGPRRCAYKVGQGAKRLHVKSVLGDIEVE